MCLHTEDSYGDNNLIDILDPKIPLKLPSKINPRHIVEALINGNRTPEFLEDLINSSLSYYHHQISIHENEPDPASREVTKECTKKYKIYEQIRDLVKQLKEN